MSMESRDQIVKRTQELIEKIIPAFTPEEADRLNNNIIKRDNINLFDDIVKKYNLTYAELRFCKKFAICDI